MANSDLIIIGSGPGGYVAAIRAAQLGAKVTIVEKEKIGGTCLNYGCIPTKALCQSASSVLLAKRMEEFGVIVGEPRVDMSKVHAWKQRAVDELTGGVEKLLKGYKVNVLHGEAKLIHKNKILVSMPDGKSSELESKYILIATGSKETIPDVPGMDLEGVVTSKELLGFEGLPERLLIYGGGYIAMEFASIYNALGSKVTVMVRSKVLRLMDGEISKRMNVFLRRKGVTLYEGTLLDRIEEGQDGLVIHASGKTGEVVLGADMVLVATGNTPNVEGLGCEDVGIKTGEKGIVADELYRTSTEGIYAIGDVLGPPYLAHVASAEGRAAAEAMFGKPTKVNYDVIPAAVFTIPEVGTVGKTEEELQSEGIPYRVGKFLFGGNGKAVAMGEEEGLVKVLAYEDGKLAGVHIIGPHASDLIHEAAIAMHAGVTAEEMDSCIHAHPTLAEVFHEAVMNVTGQAIHQLPKRR
ncbi:MAG: dihydrolipoyl dehydrogenase [Acetomicrobium sp.]